MQTLTTLILFYLIHFTTALPSNNNIGVNYGRLGDNLPSPRQAIQLLSSMNVAHVKLYDANHQILTLLSGTHLDVSIMVTNQQISHLASNRAHADQWVQENILAHYPSTRIRHLLVRNEILSSNDPTLWLDLVPAMQNLKASLRDSNIHNIKIGTPLAMDALDSSFPPSSGRFRSDFPILPLLKFLNGTRSFFFLDAYPYLAWLRNPNSISLDFALLEGGGNATTYVDPGSGLVYADLLDQMLDSVYFAMERLGFGSVRVAVSETGWPHEGDIDEAGANAYNAEIYVRNLVKKVSTRPPLGTPARPGVEIPTFLFSLFDEDQKPGPGTERHWGILDSNGRPVYEVDFTGENNETTVELPGPLNNEPFHGRIWCVAASDAGLMELGRALDLTCGQGSGACDELAPGRACYEPVSVVAHASYAFSSYWAKYRSSGAACYFNGLAVQTITDPSHGSCQFPSVMI